MPKTVRTAKPKRRSVNKRAVMIGKRTKCARKFGSRRRIRMIRGGANWITNENRHKLTHIWNSLFYEKTKSRLNDRLTAVPVNASKKKALFVIDMQMDFMDVKYQRAQGETHPVFKTELEVGNFSVAQAGSELVNGVVKKIDEVLAEDGLVIFSRDYHPVGHSSFSKTAFYEPNLCGVCETDPTKCDSDGKFLEDGGVFPAHCVQGRDGSRFVKQIQERINKLRDDSKLGNVVIAFKGIHKDSDSYTAVDKNVIDAAASNSKRRTCLGCSNISGGYKLFNKRKNVDVSPLEASTYMGVFTETITTDLTSSLFSVGEYQYTEAKDDWELKKIDYVELLQDCDVIEVCGLAGDYCVRDTVVALAQKFPIEKRIVLLGDLTAYPFLPFGTINTIPQHVSEKKYNSETYTAFNGETDFEKTYFDQMFKAATDTALANKDITLYLMKFDDEGKQVLLTKDEIEKANYAKDVAMNLAKPTLFHFITPHQEILDDYLPYENVLIQMNDYSVKSKNA